MRKLPIHGSRSENAFRFDLPVQTYWSPASAIPASDSRSWDGGGVPSIAVSCAVPSFNHGPAREISRLRPKQAGLNPAKSIAASPATVSLAALAQLLGRPNHSPSAQVLPIGQRHNHSITFCFPAIPIVRCHEHSIVMFECDGVIERVEQVMVGLDRECRRSK
jgi:hypothetical protein